MSGAFLLGLFQYRLYLPFIVLIALNIYLIINANKINKLLKNLEYNFCYKDELKDYHLFGKNTKEEKKYNKYSEWKDGIQNKYYEQINCNDNIYGYI